jgi:hypothetical protein
VRIHALTTLTAGLLALLASPALAGTVKLTNPSDAGPVQVTFDEGSPTYGTAYGTVNGVTFGTDQLFADLDFSDPSAGIPYNGFANLFPSGGTVGSNFVIDYLSDTQLDSTDIRSRQITIDLGAEYTTVGFHFMALPIGDFDVDLFDGSTRLTGVGEFQFGTTLDGNQMPILGFAGLRNTDGFDKVQITLLQDQYFAMNDLRFGAVIVPLPPAAYLGAGLLLGIGILRRMRRRRASL